MAAAPMLRHDVIPDVTAIQPKLCGESVPDDDCADIG
jgi:hypothetical protein